VWRNGVIIHAQRDRQIHFALEYNRGLATKVFGNHCLLDPPGISGCLVWNTRFVECFNQGKEWAPGCADVAGIVWFWNEDDVVAVTRVEYVRSFVDRGRQMGARPGTLRSDFRRSY
jgi:hypothetical protein